MWLLQGSHVNRVKAAGTRAQHAGIMQSQASLAWNPQCYAGSQADKLAGQEVIPAFTVPHRETVSSFQATRLSAEAPAHGSAGTACAPFPHLALLLWQSTLPRGAFPGAASPHWLVQSWRSWSEQSDAQGWWRGSVFLPCLSFSSCHHKIIDWYSDWFFCGWDWVEVWTLKGERTHSKMHLNAIFTAFWMKSDPEIWLWLEKSHPCFFRFFFHCSYW